MRIERVFFDFDGVLTTDEAGSITTCRHVSACTGVPFEQVRLAFGAHNRALTLGQVTHEAVWPRICEALGRPLPIDVLAAAFDSTPMNVEMLDLARRLRADCGVGIITDNKVDRMQRLIARHRLDALFDPIVVSAAEGASKSSGALFERALAIARAPAARCVFIDNDADNVAAAAACGLHAIHFDFGANDVAGLAARLQRDYALPTPSATSRSSRSHPGAS